MPASPLDSTLYGELFGGGAVAALFREEAEIRAMLDVEGALARVQGRLGLIPAASAAIIADAARQVRIDPAALAAQTARNAVPVPALVDAFRDAIDAPEHAQYVHWGATSQDIMDTALMLRMRDVLDVLQHDLMQALDGLARHATTHAALPMAARSYGQDATPTTFGAVAAGWGWPLLRYLERLSQMRPRLLNLSLGGAAGTLSAMQGQGAALRAELARDLSLFDPGASWHSARDGIAELSGWMAGLCGSLAKMAEDLILLVRSGVGEVRLNMTGGSSTMPHKQNPVQPSAIVALGRQVNALDMAIKGVLPHREQRDGAAWMTEWLALPQTCIATAGALQAARAVVAGLAPVPEAMKRNLDDGLGLIHAEALSFELARTRPRPQAQAEVARLSIEARDSGTPLLQLAAQRWPDLAIEPMRLAQPGEAAQAAQDFVDALSAVRSDAAGERGPI